MSAPIPTTMAPAGPTAYGDDHLDYDSDDDSLMYGMYDTDEEIDSSRDETPFRFKDLPLELRMRVYRLLIPQHARIALDPKNIRNPGAFVGTKNNRKILSVLLVSKAFHAEIIPLLYGDSTFCLINPLSSEKALSFIGQLALNNIQKLEVQVSNGLVDLGAIWDDLNGACTKLKYLKLVFYHDHKNWMSSLADFALMPQPKPKIDLHLYTSIWANATESASNIRTEIDQALEKAERRRKVIRYTGLPKVTHITIAASVSGVAAFAFLTYTHNGKVAFEAKIDKENDKRTCLRWKA